jgi:hypothetical protein
MLFFLSFSFPIGFCVVYENKTLLVLNNSGGIFLNPVQPIIALRCGKNTLYAVVNAKAGEIVVLKHLLIYIKTLLFKKLGLFLGGQKKQVMVKGLGYRVEFLVLKNRQFLNFKISYSHKVMVPVYLGISFLRLKNGSVLFEGGDGDKLSSILNLLFHLKPINVYKHKGIFLKKVSSFIPKPSKKKT